MFLHLGKDFVIPLKDIIAIIDSDSRLNSKDTLEFIKIAQEEGFIKPIVEDEIKSYVIPEKMEKDKKNGSIVRNSIIYGTNISSTTLLKRCDIL